MRRRATDAQEAEAPPIQKSFDFATAPLPGEAESSATEVFHAAGIPVFAIVLVVLLCVVFMLEIQHSTDLVNRAQPGLASLEALGAVNGKLVLADHQWWRVLTAPLLHGSLSHLIGNCVALVMAGFLLEPLIGGPWFVALFVLAGLGGSAGSLAQNNPNIVSVGASGAIMGVMALAFLAAERAPDAKRARRMRARSLFFGLPAILPVFLGEVHDHVDYGAHLGGFLAGAVVWLLLGLTWPRGQARPAMGGVAALLAAGGGGAALLALGLAMTNPAAAVAQDGPLAPSSAFPRTGDDGVKRSAELVARWPDDPRMHYLRALYFLDRDDTADAAEQLRTGLALMPRYRDELKPEVSYRMSMVLAAIVRANGDLAAARSMAAEACAAPETKQWDLRKNLARQKICR